MQSLRIVLEIKSERWKGYFKKPVWMKFREVGKMNSGVGVRVKAEPTNGMWIKTGVGSVLLQVPPHSSWAIRRMWFCMSVKMVLENCPQSFAECYLTYPLWVSCQDYLRFVTTMLLVVSRKCLVLKSWDRNRSWSIKPTLLAGLAGWLLSGQTDSRMISKDDRSSQLYHGSMSFLENEAQAHQGSSVREGWLSNEECFFSSAHTSDWAQPPWLQLCRIWNLLQASVGTCTCIFPHLHTRKHTNFFIKIKKAVVFGVGNLTQW